MGLQGKIIKQQEAVRIRMLTGTENRVREIGIRIASTLKVMMMNEVFLSLIQLLHRVEKRNGQRVALRGQKMGTEKKLREE